ncbi:hypothetical protein FF1_040099 [Malus domestica]
MDQTTHHYFLLVQLKSHPASFDHLHLLSLFHLPAQLLPFPHGRRPTNPDDIILLEMSKSRLGARRFLHLLRELDGHLARRRLGI